MRHLLFTWWLLKIGESVACLVKMLLQFVVGDEVGFTQDTLTVGLVTVVEVVGVVLVIVKFVDSSALELAEVAQILFCLHISMCI